MIKCHKVLGLQEHFTIEQDAEELHRTAISNRVQAETSREKFCLETAPEGWQWRRRGDARRQAVPYTRSRDRKCAVADGGVARWRYDECRRWRWPKAPSRIYLLPCPAACVPVMSSRHWGTVEHLAHVAFNRVKLIAQFMKSVSSCLHSVYRPKEDILSSENMLIEWAVIETVKNVPYL